MGFWDAILGRTAPGKYAAALNALMAKHMYFKLSEESRYVIHEKLISLMVSSGTPRSVLPQTLESMAEPEWFCFVSQAYMSIGIPPVFRQEFPRGNWNYLSNPFVALSGAENEIEFASRVFKKDYGVDINISSTISVDQILDMCSQQQEEPSVNLNSEKEQTSAFDNNIKTYGLNKNQVMAGIIVGLVIALFSVFLFGKNSSKHKTVNTDYLQPSVEAPKPVQAPMSAVAYPVAVEAPKPIQLPMSVSGKTGDIDMIVHWRYVAKLNKLSPRWREIRFNPEFDYLLNQPDLFTKITPREIIIQAESEHDANKAAETYNYILRLHNMTSDPDLLPFEDHSIRFSYCEIY